MSFFTQQHFDLLKKWAKQKYEKNDAVHQSAYQELASVYKSVFNVGKHPD